MTLRRGGYCLYWLGEASREAGRKRVEGGTDKARVDGPVAGDEYVGQGQNGRSRKKRGRSWLGWWARVNISVLGRRPVRWGRRNGGRKSDQATKLKTGNSQ